MGMFNFAGHAAKATENMKAARDRSLRELEGVSLRLEITDLIQKKGENPKTIKKKGSYVTTGFKFKVVGFSDLADTTDKQRDVAEKAIGSDVALIFNLHGDPNNEDFAVINDRNLADLLTVCHAAMVNKILRDPDGGLEAARDFKNPFYPGNYATQEAQGEAQQAVGNVLDGAFDGDDESVKMVLGAQIICDNKQGRLKDDSDPSQGHWFNMYFKPCFEQD